MREFDRLVGEQLKIMNELLDLQMELERYQRMSRIMKDHVKLEEIQEHIQKTQRNLHTLQEAFEQQTHEVIQSFQKEKVIHY
ncbi:MAG: YgaB family protein [Ectobacillus sp.]